MDKVDTAAPVVLDGAEYRAQHLGDGRWDAQGEPYSVICKATNTKRLVPYEAEAVALGTGWGFSCAGAGTFEPDAKWLAEAIDERRRDLDTSH